MLGGDWGGLQYVVRKKLETGTWKSFRPKLLADADCECGTHFAGARIAVQRGLGSAEILRLNT